MLRVDILEDLVRIAMRDIGLDLLLAALRALVDHAGVSPGERVSRFQLPPSSAAPPPARPDGLPLLDAAIDWVHAVLRSRVGRLTGDNGDLPGLTVTAATVADQLDARPPRTAFAAGPNLEAVEAALSQALATAKETSEPLAVTVRALELSDLEFRLLALALAPELDPRYQSCVGLLLDNVGRRVATLGLCAESAG